MNHTLNAAKGLFMDRDGTLILDKHYLHDPDEVEIIPGTAEALGLAKELGFLLFLFTNQSGISRGYYSLESVHLVNERMESLLGLPDPLFTKICIAPEAPGDPIVYRKPSPLFIIEMLDKYSMDPSQSYMVGDKQADILAGINGGVIPIMVETGKSQDPGDFPELHEHNVERHSSLLHFIRSLPTP